MELQKPKYAVSVIVPTYNRSELLNYTLLSLLKQNIAKSRYEVIVADDGSTDNTRQVVKKFEGVMNVKYVFQEDLGYRPGSARNLGIRAAEGRICVLADAGVLLNTDCLRQHIRFYNENGPGVAAIGYVYGFDRTVESEDLLKKLVNPEDAATSIRRLSKNSIFWDIRDEHYFKHKDLLHELPATWFYFWTCHVSAARQDLLDIGLFDPAYDGRWGVEDNDLGYRLQDSGVNIHLLRTAEAIHYPHAKEKEERRLEGYQNCLHFYNKYPVPEVKLFLDSYMNTEEFVDINGILKKAKKLVPLRQTA